MPGRVGFDPTTTNDAEARFRLGAIYEHEGYFYRYVQFKDAITYAAGMACVFSATDGLTAVTIDASEGTGCAAGVVLGAQTENYYGFILVNGVHDAVLTNGDDDIAAGANVFWVSGDTGVVDSGTTRTGAYIGTALAADVDAANTVQVYVNTF